MSRAVSVEKRVPNDARPTPNSLAHAVCIELRQRYGAGGGSTWSPHRILEPSAGAGAFVRAAAAVWPDRGIVACDIADYETHCLQSGAGMFIRGDCTNLVAELHAKGQPNKFDLIIGNPPFRLAEEHIRALIPLLAPGGRLVFVLRINFYGSSERATGAKRGRKKAAEAPVQEIGTGAAVKLTEAFWKNYPEDEMWPISPRPSFGRNKDGKKGTDGTEYAAFIWRLNLDGSVSARRYRGDHVIWTSGGADEAAVANALAPTALPAASEVFFDGEL